MSVPVTVQYDTVSMDTEYLQKSTGLSLVFNRGLYLDWFALHLKFGSVYI